MAGEALRTAVEAWLAAEDERIAQWNAVGECGHDDPYCPEMTVIRDTGDASYDRQKAAISAMREALAAASPAVAGEDGLDVERLARALHKVQARHSKGEDCSSHRALARAAAAEYAALAQEGDTTPRKDET